MLSILALALGLSAPQTALDQGVAQQQQAVQAPGRPATNCMKSHAKMSMIVCPRPLIMER